MNYKIDIFDITFLIFLVLKLIGAIDWSWWWVTAPLWLPSTIVVAFYALVVVIGLVVILITD